MVQPVWTENTETASINASVGVAKMGAAFAITTIAAIRFGGPILAAGTAVSLAEIADIKFGSSRGESIYHEIDTSLASQTGLRSIQRGIAYATLARMVILAKFGGLPVLSGPVGVWAGRLLALTPALPSALLGYKAIAEWNKTITGHLNQHTHPKNLDVEQKLFLALGLKGDLIDWQ